MKNYILRRKKLLIIVFLFIIVFSFFFFNYSTSHKKVIQEKKENFNVSELPAEDLELGSGYGLAVNSLVIDQESQIKGEILMNTPQDLLNVHFKNRGNSGKYILKVFYDFKEANFSINNKNYENSYIFDLESGKSIDISFSLDQKLKKDKYAHKLIVAVYAAPQKNAKSIKAMTNSYGMTLPYEIHFKGEKNTSVVNINNEYQIPLDQLNIQYQGLMINVDFSKSKEVLYPPYVIKAKRGENLKLAYYSGKYSKDVQDYLIISMVDWKHVKMNGKNYFLIKNNPNKLDYGTFSIRVPDTKGLYEYSALIIPNPTKNLDELTFSPLETAYRFTIEVE